jgi:hypothetical protein
LLSVLQLLLTTCLSLATTTSISQAATTTKRPFKSNSSNTSSSAGTATLPSSCLRLAAGIYGCRLLYRHRQLLQQQISSSQVNQELCRLLQDHQQQHPQVKEMLVTALAGLLVGASTAQHGAQLLCVLAGEVFPEQQQQQQGLDGQRSKQQSRKQQQQAGIQAAAATAAATRSDTVLLQLELLTLVLSAEPSVSAAAAPGTAGDNAMPHSQTAALLAAAMLPVLLPAALMTNAAIRRLWLSIASTAAEAAAPAAAAEAEVAAATEAHRAGVAALAAAARFDKDANIRSKALGLLTDAVPYLWQHITVCGLMGWQHVDLPATEAAAAAGISKSSSQSISSSSGYAVVSAALQAQLMSSSKSCRAKALLLLQQLLSDPSQVLAAAAAQHAQQQQQQFAHPFTSPTSCKQYVVQWQQQLVADTFPCLAALLAAPQDSPLHCPASRAAAEELLPCMAQLLQPQQALQLALDSSAACGGGSDAAAAGQLLASLSQCSEAEVYAVLKQQLTALDDTTSAGSAQHAREEQHQAHGGVRLRQLQQLLAAGGCCSEPLRRHAFLAVCEALNTAADCNSGIQDPPPTTNLQQQSQVGGQDQQQQQQGGLQEAAAQLLLSVQLLELAGGCSSPQQQPRDFRGELAILADALDWCCFCMQSAAAVRAAAAADHAAATEDSRSAHAGLQVQVEAETAGVSSTDAEEHQEQQQKQKQKQLDHKEQQQPLFATTTRTLQELLASLLRILHTAAHAAAAAAAAASSKQQPAHASAGIGLTAGPGSSSGLSQLLLAGLGSTLLHHLELVVSLTACAAESAAAAALLLPVEVLGQYIQVRFLTQRLGHAVSMQCKRCCP